MWSWYQGFSYLGGKFSQVEGKPGISGSRIFGYNIFGQNAPPPESFIQRVHKDFSKCVKGKTLPSVGQ